MKPIWTLSGIVVMLVATYAPAREMTKREKAMRLQLERAELVLEQAKSEYEKQRQRYEEMKELKARGIITGDELNSAREAYERAKVALKEAQINLEQTVLGFVEEATHISIIRAQKYRAEDGTRRVRLTLKNTSDVKAASAAYKDVLSPQEVRALVGIENIFVSILKDGVLIGDPYEVRIPSLAYGQEVTVEFGLQRDAEEVTVRMKYLNKAEDRKVYLQKSGREDVVSVMSLQFAQEGELGSSVVFDLELERMAEDEKTFALDVVGLPSKYRYQFEYQGKQLSQVKFSQGMAKLSLGLRVWVPRELPEEEIGKPVSFFAVVADKYGAEQLRRLRRKLGGRQIREDDLKPLKLGYEVLELTPKGVGEIELSSPNLYYEIRPDQKLEMKFTLRNTGTVVLEDVRVEVDPPAQWEYRVVPEKVDRIEPQKEVPVKVEVTPPGDVEVGKYEVKVGASCEHEGKLVEAQEKNVTVNVQGKANVLGSALLVMLLVGIVVGVAIFTVKLSRR
ncbi:MAG: hypothetical protein DRP94_09185 [Candidatus Latescibacterota bacterium]|nr:MAG: hypothetical protein DRP94_09185 [Candidatus Latescibacterota bacterium]